MIRIELPVDVARPVQEVFAYVTDLERLGEWQPNVVSVTKQTEGPMGQGTRPSLEAMGVIVNKVDEPDLVASTVQGAAHLAFNTWKPAAVLLGQRVLGAKNFKELARK